MKTTKWKSIEAPSEEHKEHFEEVYYAIQTKHDRFGSATERTKIYRCENILYMEVWWLGKTTWLIEKI